MGTTTQPETLRAWAEVDLDALAYNASQLRSALPGGCGLMAIMKADAYGHGAEASAKRLRREGVGAFAVATAHEGAGLRDAGVEGDILVLGYTHPEEAALLNGRSLAQLVADGAHAKALDDAGYKLEVHIAVDTGMHRLGFDYTDVDGMERVYNYNNLAVRGVATHFAVSDSLLDSDVAFTKLQIERYNSVLESLRLRGRDVGARHAQASSGILNYPGMECDYARAGIALYGVKALHAGTVTDLPLRPVLSLRARIAQVRRIGAGESVSYGRAFYAENPIRLATVNIGYADGVPRQMSGNGGVCLVRGERVPIAGRICMDMLMLDVTGVDTAEPGDIVTLIGLDGGEEIRCEDVARSSGTITNDILCRLGKRLPRVYIENVECKT